MNGALLAATEAALSGHEGRDVLITATRSISGGCISPGLQLETDNGDRYFMKTSGSGNLPPDFMAQEARSLRALAATGTLRTPGVIAAGQDWLILEWLEPGSPSDHTWTALGTGLAALHGHRASRFGWDTDNYIGSFRQRNSESDGWAEFWVERRLGPQWRSARDAGRLGEADDRAFDSLLARRTADLDAGNHDGPSLLHGDLWNGNLHVLAGGEPAIIDPSTYYGHREVDLSIARLFGGFDREFYRAYDEAWPLEPGFHEVRCGLYQLYYVLVHVNLFGGGYVSQTRDLLSALS